MNRRKMLKGSLVVGAVSLSGVGLYWWQDVAISSSDLESPNITKLVAALADTIIPTTETPGAKDCEIEGKIIAYFLDVASLKVANNFMRGLVELESQCKSRYGASFLELSRSKREEIIIELENEAAMDDGFLKKVEQRIFGKTFIVSLKEVTCWAYAHSYLGATKGLSYQQVPGVYLPDIPLEPEHKNYAKPRF